MSLKNVAVKGMDASIWQRAKVAAIKRSMTLAAWLTEAIRTKLRKENG